jgi:hypothetical protein
MVTVHKKDLRRGDALASPTGLMQIDGQLWLALMLETGPTGGLGAPPRDSLCHGRASLEQLRAMKRECKRHLKRSRDPEVRLGALAGYFATVAAALVHYGQLICNRSRGELEPILLELSEVTPRAWSVLFMQAAIVPDRTQPPTN